MRGKIASFLFLCVSMGLSAQASDPVLMRINGVDIKKSEFEYIYNKNNTAETVEQKDLDEYLELFKNFKLKVFEAKAQGLDTLPSFKNELNGYRRQLSQPYLEDKDAEEFFIREAYDRMKENVSVSHILVRLPFNYTVADTLDAYNRIMEIRERVAPSNKRKKAEDFNMVAKEVSEDPSAETNSGLLGYISAFSTVYPFENAAYSTPVGTISMPVRSSYGYHIIKVEDRRPDPGQVLASHIMISYPREADEETMEKARLKADSVYQLIKGGMDFSEAAKEYSEDRGTAQNGGELPWFGVGRMIKEFENVAFSLNKGDVSEPFQTAFGYHIMQVKDKKDLAPYEEQQKEIRSMIMRSDRNAEIKNTTANRLKKEYNYTPDNAALQEVIALAMKGEAVDSAFIADGKQLNKVLFTLNNEPYTQAQFVEYVEKNPNSPKATPSDALTDKYEQYVNASVFSYQDQNLENQYKDFANLMNEYHDGILLFEVSNKEVWDKASKDTEGLTNYFNQHKDEYKWDKPRYKGFVISCADAKTRKDAEKLVKKTASDSIIKVLNTTFNTPEKSNIKVERVLVTEGENKAVDCFGFKTLNKKEYESPENYPEVFVTGKILKDGPETYQDVRGLVTSDYQNYLEEEWLKYLRDKYTVEVNEDVLRSVQNISSK
ncbi:MAG: peptidylprolyl isomerase [Candidatus Azobacteroides sp.]|nr:peptidylprolyl isomerase [Candidatus Azobacteroides sp.]